MHSQPKVLVADDDEDMLDSVGEAFVQWGCMVVRAASGAELMSRLADSGPFALVVTDISMPLMSGLQAMHSARYIGVDTPVIVMTGLEGNLKEQVAALGPRVFYLRKPFPLEALEQMAIELLGIEGDGLHAP